MHTPPNFREQSRLLLDMLWKFSFEMNLVTRMATHKVRVFVRA